MTPALDLAVADNIQRQVLVAAVALDPFTGRTVSQGLEIAAEGLAGAPIVNLSGQFVWRVEGAAQPAQFIVTPKTPAYQPMQVAAPPLPPPGAAGERLVRILLQPTQAYPFPDGAIVLRGRLVLTAGGAPLADALLRLQWKDENDLWIGSSAVFLTGPDGAFAVGVVTPPGARPTLNSPPLLVRLAATRGAVTKVTPEAVFRPGARATPPGAAPPVGEVAWDVLQLP
ncbi:MAG: hypothetical protein JWQ29_1223 [Phenylobacterium sp.]|nr:hypothetical protein [Phenylobacterium sp.]